MEMGNEVLLDTLLDADLESDALGWQYISGTLPDGREFDRIDNPQLEGYKFDPNGEYVRRWLPELARLPTEWIHHPWDAPETVLDAAGIELGSNYPLPIVEISAAKARLQEALTEMWQLEAASRAAMENGTEEGLGDSSEIPLIDFPQDIQMEVDLEPVRVNNNPNADRRHEDQMVPSMTASLVRVEEVSVDVGNSAGESRGEVPTNINFDPEPQTEAMNQGGTRPVRNNVHRPNAVDSTAESSSTWTERDGGVVPVWSPPTVSSHSEPFVADETGIRNGGFLQRHPQTHRLMNWRQLSQTNKELGGGECGAAKRYWVDS